MEPKVQTGIFIALIKTIERLRKKTAEHRKSILYIYKKRQSEALPPSMFDVGRSMFDVKLSAHHSSILESIYSNHVDPRMD